VCHAGQRNFAVRSGQLPRAGAETLKPLFGIALEAAGQTPEAVQKTTTLAAGRLGRQGRCFAGAVRFSKTTPEAFSTIGDKVPST
jgi:hypothetical protein